jgi:hypothetical protein
LTAGDDVKDADEQCRRGERRLGGHRRCRSRRRLRPVDGSGRRLPASLFVEWSLFNLEEKSSCRFSADAESGIAHCNSWLMVRKAARGSPAARRQSANRGGGAIRGRPTHASVLRHAHRPRLRADAPWPAATPAKSGKVRR